MPLDHRPEVIRHVHHHGWLQVKSPSPSPWTSRCLKEAALAERPCQSPTNHDLEGGIALPEAAWRQGLVIVSGP